MSKSGTQTIPREIEADDVKHMIQALQTVSFYARINHGSKCKDYGEIVDPVLESIGVETGSFPSA